MREGPSLPAGRQVSKVPRPRVKEPRVLVLLLATGKKAVVLEPAASNPAEVESPLLGTAVEARTVAIATRIPPDRTETHDRVFPLFVGILLPVEYKVLNSCGNKSLLIKLGDDLVSGEHLVEVHHNQLLVWFWFALNWEILGGDIFVHPVKFGLGDQSLQNAFRKYCVGVLDEHLENFAGDAAPIYLLPELRHLFRGWLAHSRFSFHLNASGLA